MKQGMGFVMYLVAVALLLCLLPVQAFDPQSDLFLLSVGLIAIWRYVWMGIHYLRAFIYMRFVFPRWRKSLQDDADNAPSKLYILATFYRIPTHIAARVLHALWNEASSFPSPVMIVLSIVEPQDEEMIRHIFGQSDVPESVSVHIVRAQGKGKRHGLAQGIRAISRDMPEGDALCVMMDGDTVLLPHSLHQCAGFFSAMPKLGACTTDEIGVTGQSGWMQNWYDLRFAQRHILMSSLSLSRRVMTLTGRMSMFRAPIVVDPQFIECVENDHLDHWRLGKLPFLTGDDKSTLYSLMAQGYEQIYIPDVRVVSMEPPPDKEFIRSTTRLMQRWFGNMLRSNGRVLRLGFGRMPFFVWWSFLDQRLYMWTTFCGPVFAMMLSFRYGPILILYYIVWIALMRGLQSASLLMARPSVSWRYPFLLYYNQVYGAFIKIWTLFHLFQQGWTRQGTHADRRQGAYLFWARYSSKIVYGFSVLLVITLIGFASSTLSLPPRIYHNVIDMLRGFGA